MEMNNDSHHLYHSSRCLIPQTALYISMKLVQKVYNES